MYYQILSTEETLVSPKPARITNHSTILYSPHKLTLRKVSGGRFHVLVAQRLQKRGKLIPYIRFKPDELNIIPYNQVPATLLWIGTDEDPSTCELGEVAKSRYHARPVGGKVSHKETPRPVKQPDDPSWKKNLAEFAVPCRKRPSISYDRALRDVDNRRKEFVFKFIASHGVAPNPRVCAYRWHLTESAALKAINGYVSIWNSISPVKVRVQSTKSKRVVGGKVMRIQL